MCRKPEAGYEITGSKCTEYPEEEVVQKLKGNPRHNKIISACKVGNIVTIVKC